MTAIASPRCPTLPLPGGLCLQARAARAVLERVAKRVPVDLLLPDGTLLGHRAGASRHTDRPGLQIVRPTAMFERLAHGPKLAIGESYQAGDWRAAEGSDLAEVMLPFAQRLRTAVPPVLRKLRRVVDQGVPEGFRNTLSGARQNIEAHYDLSNEMFEAFLDESMSYSAALFDHTRSREEQTLHEAQLRKVDSALDLASVQEGSRVLEIGTGWGTLALRAAQRGAHVVSVTLSGEQAALARQRVAEAGMDDRVDIRVQDYREVEGLYDAIVSIEMIEAVGDDYWPTYFATIDQRLAPGGTVSLQAILMDHDRYLATRSTYGWINKHIFPGGIIPSLHAIEQVTRQHTGLEVDVVHKFGDDYATTLHRWRTQFLASWDRVNALGFDEVFRRTWEFYLAYCEAGFAGDAIDVAQIRMRRPERR